MRTALQREPGRARPRQLLRGLLALAAALLLFHSLELTSVQAQTSRKALSKNEVIELLESGVSPTRVEELSRQYGLAFTITSSVETELRDAGATDELVEALRKLGPQAPAAPPSTPTAHEPPTTPPILLIEATPGGAQVYVDDKPVGTTSSSGRLKLTRLAPGEHAVRLSSPGHRDYETRITLSRGETTPVAAILEAAGPSRAEKPQVGGSGATPGTAASSAALGQATLGVGLARQAPAGVRGAYINAVAPSSPAERAGLRAGYSILAIDDHAINSPQQAIEVLTQFQPGAIVRITYSDGQNVQITRAQLVPRAALPPLPTQATPSSGANPPAASAALPVVSFAVAHDHGPPPPNYCVGIMTIGNGMIQYRSANGMHSFDIPVDSVREARKNAVYMAVNGAFHIRLKKGTNYNFVVINAAGQFLPPDTLLQAIDRVMGRQ
ncbi:MAG: PEGA domain-containing protein [Acidobacteriia bacterium]|nr:PEGA domain-containing protein [Terriglobia bacterium]